MKNVILLPLILLLTACVSPNTKDEFFSKGKPTPEVVLSAPLIDVEKALGSYISKCFRNRETVINGIPSIISFSIEPVRRTGERGIWVKQWVKGGYLHVVYFRFSRNAQGQSTLSAVERPKLGTIYDELEVMAKGDVPFCELI